MVVNVQFLKKYKKKGTNKPQSTQRKNSGTPGVELGYLVLALRTAHINRHTQTHTHSQSDRLYTVDHNRRLTSL